ncbi:hypothetical protein SSX86_021128 [Deinandra increscens subsp. villosa]|uniref:Uncharacterized protein n=1 Tax=Deinandra increscens subsp. villosa TaxID=3103831 RepID=A0AAP0CPA7_9ASTR
MATALLSSPSSHLLRPTSSSPTSLSSSPLKSHIRISNNNAFPVTTRTDTKRRRNLVYAVNQEAEDAFKKTVELDRLIDMLKNASDRELQKLVVENILTFNEGFWIRLAARTDTCKSDDDKQDLEELASCVMTIVDRVVHKTNEKIESATDVLKGILSPVVNEVEEICWPPRDPNALDLMEKEVNQREQEGQLDEGFLSEVNAQLRQAKEDGDKPGLEAMLQKVLQLYASRVLSKRSYAMKGNKVLKAEQCLEEIIKAPESEWNNVLIDHLSCGKGDISPDELYAVIKKRTERTLIRTEGGSYQQRILVEFLKGIQSRTEEIAQVLQGKPRNLVYAVNQEAEDAFKKTVELDRLIDMLKNASDRELQKLVVENILTFNEGFWIRLAARTDTCKSDDDKQDLEELASCVMTIVDRVVHKTNEKIESATDVLKGILSPVVNEVEEICWPPRDPNALNLMEKEVNQREQEGQLDEGFLSEVNAQLRQAKEDGDKPGLEAMLQKVLQLYASRVLSKRSYAMKGNKVLKAEQCLEEIIKAPESEWNNVLIDHLSCGKGDISPDELYAVIKKRTERTLIRTEGGSYQQRILVEFLKGIQSRTEEIAQVLQGKP